MSDGSAGTGGHSEPLRRWLRIGLMVAAYALVIVAGVFAGDFLIEHLDMELRPTTEAMAHNLIMASLVTYVLLMALPFVPSIEIGLALIVMIGADIVPIVYLSTVIGLTISFTIGRLVPERRLASGFARFGLARAAGLVEQLAPMSLDERLAHLTRSARGRLAPWLLRHRHIAVAIVLNIPGNNLIGGGGGIALAAGMTRLVSFPGFILTVAIGTSPVPLGVLLLDALRQAGAQ